LWVASGTSSRIRSTSSASNPASSSRSDEPLRARAGVDTGCLDADDLSHAQLGGGRDPDDRDHLLRGQTGYGSPPLQRIARGDPHLGAAGLLTPDDVLRDVLGELLDEERLTDHDLVDRLLEQLGEAGHVHALLARVEVDEAVDLRGDELLGAAPAESDRLGDALDARPRQAEPHLGCRGLEIVQELA
jgi:hypothetical protein